MTSPSRASFTIVRQFALTSEAGRVLCLPAIVASSFNVRSRMMNDSISHLAHFVNLWRFGGGEAADSPKLVDRFVRPVLRERYVFESAIERVVVAHRRVVDPQRRVDRADHILGTDVAIGAPTVVGNVGAGRVGLADDLAAANAAA